jgi:hypothetical protein
LLLAAGATKLSHNGHYTLCATPRGLSEAEAGLDKTQRAALKDELEGRLRARLRGAAGAGGEASVAGAADDFCLLLNHIHHGKKGRSPMDYARFFDKSDESDAVARPLRDGELLGRLPRVFQRLELRCYYKGVLYTEAGRKRLEQICQAWRDEQGEVQVPEGTSAAAATEEVEEPPMSQGTYVR